MKSLEKILWKERIKERKTGLKEEKHIFTKNLWERNILGSLIS